ncbi:hypothetical protein Tco_1504222 [Tanacetum coccineum]
MVAYLEKNNGNTEFHQIMDFLNNSSIHFALTISPIISTSFVEQFWTSAKSRKVNNISYIDAIVAGKPVTISEASIRSDLLFDDADGIDTLNNQAIFDTIYSKSTSWDQFPTNIATAVICLATNQKYNFSKIIFDGMMRHLDASKKFVMYLRFLQIFLKNQLRGVPVPMDHFPVPALTKKVLSFMVKKGKNFSGNVIPLFNSMLVQPTKDEGEVSKRPSESQPIPSPTHPTEDQPESQPDPSPRPSSPNLITDSNPEGSGGNHGGQSSSDRSLSWNEDSLTLQNVYDLCISLCTQVTAQAAEIKDLKAQIKQLKKKARPVFNHHKAWFRAAICEEPETSSRTKEFHLSGDTLVVKEKDSVEKGVSTEYQVSTDKPKETIAEFLVSMSQNKAKKKGVEIKDIEDTDRPRTTSERSILTLKPPPKIDPKYKGKKVLEEEDESDAESKAEEEKKRLAEEEATKVAFTNEYDFYQARLNADKILAEKLKEEERENLTIEERAKLLHDTIAAQRRFLAQQRSEVIRNRLPSRTQLRNQMMTYLKHVGGKKHSDLKTKIFEEIQVLYEKVKRFDENFIAIGSVEDERLIKDLNKKVAGIKKTDSIKKESKEEEEEEEEGIKKRKLDTRKKMKSRKRRFRQYTSEDENDELRLCLTIAPDEDKEVDYEILDKKYPIIEWKSENLGIKP